MKKFLLILMLQNLAPGKAHCQSFNIDELITLASLPSKNTNHYMKKKGFVLSSSKSDSVAITVSFLPNIKSYKNGLDTKRSIDIYIKDDSKYFTLHTTSLDEYRQGEQSLIKSGFFYDKQKDVSSESSMFFQKANITIWATSAIKDGVIQYRFDLKEKAIPSSIGYAEDLLQFDSHEFLVSFFGEDNVKKDMYYFTEKELKKCSVLFSGTNRQVVFIWTDEVRLNKLAYILVSNSLPTAGAKNSNPLSDNNEWKLKNGICLGMTLKELLKINETDFDIYGNKSDLAFLVKPNINGKIDFKQTAVMLACGECYNNKLFNQKEVSALDVAKANLSMRIFDVVIYPSKDLTQNSLAENSMR